MNFKIATLYTLGLLVTLSSCGEKKQESTTDTTPAVSVQLHKNNYNNSFSGLTSSGKTEAVEAVNLSTRMMGYVLKINAPVGKKVKKGEVILQIQSADLSAKQAQIVASINEATAAYTNAEKDYKRFKVLFEKQSASQKEMDNVELQFQMAKARLTASKAQKNEIDAALHYSNITAPFDGIITQKFIDEGSMAQPGMPLLRIENLNEFEVVTQLSENEISMIKNNDSVNVFIKSMGVHVAGKVKEISSSSNQTGGQFLVKIKLMNTPATVISDLFVNVQFLSAKGSKNESIRVEKSALVKKGQLTGVYTVSQQNTALLRWITLGNENENSVEVLSGLTADEKYVVSAKGRLYNGAKITIQ